MDPPGEPPPPPPPPAYRPQPRLLQHAAVVAAPATSGVVQHAGSAPAPAPSSALVAHRGGAVTLHAAAAAAAAAPPDRATEHLHLALTTGVLQSNLPADQLWAQAAGPANPRGVKRFVNDGKHTLAGTLEGESLEGASFEAQYRAFMAHGVAANPAGAGGLVATAALAPALAAAGGFAVAAAGRRADAVPVGMTVHVTKRAREGAGDIADVDSWRGPWAAYAGDAARRTTPLERGELTDAQKRLRVEQGYKPDSAGKLEKDAPTPVIAPSGTGGGGGGGGGGGQPPAAAAAAAAGGDDAGKLAAGAGGGPSSKGGAGPRGAAAASSAKSGTAALIEAGRGYVPGTAGSLPPAAAAAAAEEEAAAAGGGGGGGGGSGADPAASAGAAVGKAGTSSIFHGKEAHDYQGRPWCAPPKGVRADEGDHECFIPKKPIHKYAGA
jgi:hypothetical protein